MESKKKVKYFTKEQAHEFESMDVLDEKSKIYILMLADKFLIVKRVGRCDYKKCNSACCKIMCITNHDFFKFFGEKSEFGVVIKKRCKYLKKDGKCKVWKEKKFHGACKKFPYASDGHYWEVMDKCSFRFEILFTIYDRKGERTRKEMLLNFKNQR